LKRLQNNIAAKTERLENHLLRIREAAQARIDRRREEEEKRRDVVLSSQQQVGPYTYPR